MNNTSLTAAKRSFDSGQGLSEHEGEMIIMPANEPHALKAINKFKMILTMIRSKR